MSIGQKGQKMDFVNDLNNNLEADELVASPGRCISDQ